MGWDLKETTNERHIRPICVTGQYRDATENGQYPKWTLPRMEYTENGHDMRMDTIVYTDAVDRRPRIV